MRTGKIFHYTRIGIFTALVLVQVLLFFTTLSAAPALFNLPKWLIVLAIEVVFTVSNALNFFLLKEFRHKIACYVLEFLLQLLLTLLISDGYLLIIYLLVLSEYYISAPHLRDNVSMGIASLVTYVVISGVMNYVTKGENVLETVVSCFTQLLLIALHFFATNFALYSYDTKQTISASLQELDESNRKLQRAYDELKEVTALQERQRIAKEIHDTAGHAITTVIMQTEAAKLVLDEDPKEAKRRIVAANLQAKNALEELRESVHLLAGRGVKKSLKEELEGIVHDSSDGTGVTVRCDVEDVACSPEKARFFANTLKEGISNGIRHGKATAFYFSLRASKQKITFLLSDNGYGADMGAMKQGFGLQETYRRAESMGGKVTLTSAAGEGFEIKIVLPTDKKEDEKGEEK